MDFSKSVKLRSDESYRLAFTDFFRFDLFAEGETPSEHKPLIPTKDNLCVLCISMVNSSLQKHGIGGDKLIILSKS